MFSVFKNLRKKFGLRSKLIILTLCVSVPSLLLFWWLRFQSEAQIVNLAAAATEEITRSVAAVEQVVDSMARGSIMRISRSDVILGQDLDACENLLKINLSVSAMYEDILLTDQHGKVLASGTSSAPAFIYLPPLSLDNRPVTLPSVSLPQYPSKVIPYVQRVTRDGRIIGAVVTLVDSDYYGEVMAPLFSADWVFAIMDSDGNFVFNSSPDSPADGGEGAEENISHELWLRIQERHGRSGWFRAAGPGGSGGSRIVSFLKLGARGGRTPHTTIVTLFDEKNELRKTTATITGSVLFVLCVMAVSSALAIHFGNRYLASPIEKLLAMTKRFAAGELGARSGVDYRLDEVGMLARSFDDMAGILQAKDARQRATDEELALYMSKLEDNVRLRTAALEESHAMMEAIYETTSSGYATIDENFVIVDCNPAMLHILKACGMEELNDGGILRFSPTFQANGRPSAELYREYFDKAMKGDFAALEWLFLDSEGGIVPCDITLSRVYVNGRRLIVAGVHDVSDQQRAQEALSQQREQLKNILNSTPITLALIADGKIHTVNENGANLLGIRVGDDSAAMFASGAEWAETLKTLDLGQPVKNRPIKLKDAGGGEYDALLSLRYSFYERKKVLLAWIVDVTELTRARTAAEQGARAKSDFLASMSHEIRTPMNAILGMAHLCLLTEMTDKQRSYLEKIRGAATSLLSIINDILDISKIEAGKLTLEKTQFRLSDMLKNLWDLLSFQADAKKLRLTFKADEGIQNDLIGDSLRLQQILLNICNNALKFTEKGEITLSAFSEPEGEGKTRLRFAVSDTGIGMTPGQMARLFKPFTQADSSTTRKYGGSGLGLSICKHLVESMNGSVSVESEPGRGSTFSFTVEMEAAKEPDAQSAAGGAPEDGGESMLEADVLLVEDNIINQEIALELLQLKGVAVDVAANGQEALDAVKGKRYNLIFMDVQMPVMDGLDATRRIRELPECGADKLPIVAMTAHAMQSDHEKSLAAGMNDHITKPIDVDELFKALTKWVEFSKSKQAY